MSVYQISISGRTDIGSVRVENEDAMDWYISPSQPFSVVVVADGMGGYEGGATASQIAVNSIIRDLKALEYSALDQADSATRQQRIETQIHYAISKANDDILAFKQQSPKLSQMGTTVVAIVQWNEQIIGASVGDSRIYCFCQSQFFQVSRDDTLIQELVDSGSMTPEQAAHNKDKNKLIKALGVEPQCEATLYRAKLSELTYFLLCSDGLTDYLSDNEIAAYFQNQTAPLESCYQLIDIANTRGGKDNITVVISELTAAAYEHNTWPQSSEHFT